MFKIQISQKLIFSLVTLCMVGVMLIGSQYSFAEASSLSSSPQKTVLITGANRGLGLEFAKQFKQLGYTVIGTARSPEKAVELKATGAQVVALDVTDSESVASMAKSLKGTAIDVLVNNAGVIGNPQENFKSFDFDKALMTYNINSLGPMRVTQALYDNLLEGKEKKVIHITSILGSIENNSGGYYDYRASKAALNTMNKSLSIELESEGFTCVVLHPGWVKTDLGGERAPLEPAESIKGMLAVIQQLEDDDNGKFYDYQGNSIAW